MPKRTLFLERGGTGDTSPTNPSGNQPLDADAGAALPDPSLPNAIRAAWADVQARQQALGTLRAAVYVADTNLKAAQSDPHVTPEALKLAQDKYLSLTKTYQDEVAAIGTQWSNIWTLAQDAETKAAQAGMDTAKLEQAKAEAQQQGAFIDAQVRSLDAKAKVDAADAEVARLKNATYTPAQQAEAQQALDAATTAQTQANADKTAADAATVQAALPVAGRNALAQAVYNEAQGATAASGARVAVATEGAQVQQAGGAAVSAVEQGKQEAITTAYTEDKLRADIANLESQGVLQRAQAQEILDLLESKQAYSAAQVANLEAQTQNQQLQTHQLQVGDIQTKIEQLGESVKNGMDPAAADRAMEDYLSGSTPFQRQTQREAQASHAMDTALSYGMVVGADQPYVPGFEPGGSLGSVGGVDVPSVPLAHTQSPGQYLQAQGIQTADAAAPQRFGPAGSYVQAGGPPVAAATTPESFAAEAAAYGAAQQPQQVQHAASGGTFDPTDPYLVMGSEPDWAATAGGWSGGPPGLSVPPLDPFAPGMGLYPPIGADHPFISRNAQGGTTALPGGTVIHIHAGGQGEPPGVPPVTKTPLFATANSPLRKRSPFFRNLGGR